MHIGEWSPPVTPETGIWNHDRQGRCL